MRRQTPFDPAGYPADVLPTSWPGIAMMATNSAATPSHTVIGKSPLSSATVSRPGDVIRLLDHSLGRRLGLMSARFVSSDRETVVDVIRLSATHENQDGECLLPSQCTAEPR